MAIHNDLEDWAGVGSINSGERAWLLQSPSVDTDRHLEEDRRRTAGVSLLGAVFIVVNAALGAGLLNFPAAFNMAGGVTAGVMLQMVSSVLEQTHPHYTHTHTLHVMWSSPIRHFVLLNDSISVHHIHIQ